MHDCLHALFVISGRQEVSDQEYSVRLRINPQDDLFNVHFPGMPIVPGACLIGFVMERLARWRDQAFHVTKVSRAVFGLPVTPGMVLTLSLKLPSDGSGAEKRRLVYRYTSENGQTALGTLEVSACGNSTS